MITAHPQPTDTSQHEPAIEITNLVVRYSHQAVVDDLTLQVPRGTVFGLLGANGAGKTTTIKTLLGFRTPDSGQVQVLGYDSIRARVAINARIGFVSETNTLYLDMTIPQLCAFFRATARRWDQAVVNRSLQLFGLPTQTLVRRLSKGMRTQLALSLALGGEPDLLILDEPTTGLDPLARRTFLDVLMAEAAAAGKTIFFSSHVLSDVETVADSVGILHHGKLLVSGAIDTLRQQHSVVNLSYAEPLRDDVLLAMRRVSGVGRVDQEHRNVRVYVHGDVAAIMSTLLTLVTPLICTATELSLEDIFLYYAKEGLI